eukprot:COSAG02_NODE_17761_length_983_cov_1.111991_1_plen_152_part_10
MLSGKRVHPAQRLLESHGSQRSRRRDHDVAQQGRGGGGPQRAWLALYLSIYLSAYLSVCLSICVCMWVSMCGRPSVCVCVCVSLPLALPVRVSAPSEAGAETGVVGAGTTERQMTPRLGMQELRRDARRETERDAVVPVYYTSREPGSSHPA